MKTLMHQTWYQTLNWSDHALSDYIKMKNMDFYFNTLVFLFAGGIFTPLARSEICLEPISSINIPASYSSSPDGMIQGSYGIGQDSVEQSAYDEESGLAYVIGNHYLHVVDYSNTSNSKILYYEEFGENGAMTINDVEHCGSLVALAIHNENLDDIRGTILVYEVYDRDFPGAFETAYPPFKVGNNPDMLHFSKDCRTIVTANEGEPYNDAQGVLVDPEGTVSIIRLDGQSSMLKTLDFTAFNDRVDEFLADGVRQHYTGSLGREPSTFSQTLEPEYVTYNSDGTKAYINLQENNAIAVVDLVNDVVEEIYPLGLKNWKGLGIDGSDTDGEIDLTPKPFDLYSYYQPDAIQYFSANGDGYIITGNEGDTAEYKGIVNGATEIYEDSGRGKTLLERGQFSNLDPALESALDDNDQLGRLLFDTTSEEPRFFGGRGISVFRADDMTQVWDSGDSLAQITAQCYPTIFNANSEPDDPATETPADLFDKLSAERGLKAETLTVGQLDDKTRLVFVGIGGISSIAVYTLDESGSTPSLQFESMVRAGATDQSFTTLSDEKNIGNLDPEDIRFIPAAKSPTGNPLLMVSGSTSGNLVMYEVLDSCTSACLGSGGNTGSGTDSGADKCRKGDCLGKGNGGNTGGGTDGGTGENSGGTDGRTKKCRKNKWETCNQPALVPGFPRPIRPRP